MNDAVGSADEGMSSAVVGRHRVTFFKRYLWLHYHIFSGVTHWIGRRITPIGWFVLISGFGLGVIGIDIRVNVAYQGVMFLAFVIVGAPLLTRFSRSRFAVERRAPRFGSVGSELAYSVVVENLQDGFQRGVSVMEDLPDPRPSIREFSLTPEPDEHKRNWWDRRYLFYRWKWLIAQQIRAMPTESQCPDLEPNGSVEVKMKLMPLRRGAMVLERIAIGCPDPIGLFRSLVKVSCHQKVLILPKRYHVGPLPLPGGQKYQQGGVALASQVGESEEFVSLRDYRSGDPLKKIHWPSWARTGRPIVKEFVDEFFVRHGLVLDTFTENPFSAEFEEAVSVAASFACTIEEQDSLLDLLVVGPQAFSYTVGRGVGSLDKMMEVLAGVQACRDKPFSSLENLVISHGTELSGCVCVLLDWGEDRQRFVQRLQQMQVPVKVVLITPAGDTEARDAGVMRGQEEDFHVMAADEIETGLRALS